jgi:hypothetical protein
MFLVSSLSLSLESFIPKLLCLQTLRGSLEGRRVKQCIFTRNSKTEDNFKGIHEFVVVFWRIGFLCYATKKRTTCVRDIDSNVIFNTCKITRKSQLASQTRRESHKGAQSRLPINFSISLREK